MIDDILDDFGKGFNSSHFPTVNIVTYGFLDAFNAYMAWDLKHDLILAKQAYHIWGTDEEERQLLSESMEKYPLKQVLLQKPEKHPVAYGMGTLVGSFTGLIEGLVADVASCFLIPYYGYKYKKTGMYREFDLKD
ncbi:hypothetical protein ACFL1H_04795 [Nanoarchaeota archaeon]